VPGIIRAEPVEARRSTSLGPQLAIGAVDTRPARRADVHASARARRDSVGVVKYAAHFFYFFRSNQIRVGG
jgi:hypothetical protein